MAAQHTASQALRRSEGFGFNLVEPSLSWMTVEAFQRRIRGYAIPHIDGQLKGAGGKDIAAQAGDVVKESSATTCNNGRCALQPGL